MMLIKRTNLISLRLMAFAQVMRNVQAFLAKQPELQELGLLEVKNEFDAAFLVLENALVQVRKNENTETLVELDKQRDTLLVSFATHCRLYQNHPSADKKEAAHRSVIKIEAYGKNPERRPYRDETTIIRNLITDFEQSDADRDISLIGAKEWLTLLKPVNERFETLHSSRTLEKSEQEAGQTKEAREQMQAKFDRLCKAIEAMAFVKGEEKYKALADAINEEVKDALAQIKQKKDSSEPAGDNPLPETPQN